MLHSPSRETRTTYPKVFGCRFAYARKIIPKPPDTDSGKPVTKEVLPELLGKQRNMFDDGHSDSTERNHAKYRKQTQKATLSSSQVQDSIVIVTHKSISKKGTRISKKDIHT